MLYLILLLIFAAVFFLMLQFFPKKGERMVRQRLGSESFKGNKETPPSLVRILGPLALLNRVLRVKALRQKTKQDLVSCGLNLSEDEFFALMELSAIAFALLYILLVGLNNIKLLWLFCLAGLGLIFPVLWLKRRLKARQEAIVKALPNVLDLLNLAVGAGLDFMVAVRKMIEWSRPNPLINELNLVWQETNVGKTRQEALRNMARRLNMPEISSFVRTMVQADKMGTGIEDALRRQSEEALTWRFERGERQALKAPIKMLFPLLVFILPVVLIIVAGPIILQFLEGGFALR